MDPQQSQEIAPRFPKHHLFHASKLHSLPMKLYLQRVYIINKFGGLIFSQAFPLPSSPHFRDVRTFPSGYDGTSPYPIPSLSVNDHLILASMFHSMHTIAQELTPAAAAGENSGIQTVCSRGARLACFQTYTGFKFLAVAVDLDALTSAAISAASAVRDRHQLLAAVTSGARSSSQPRSDSSAVIPGAGPLGTHPEAPPFSFPLFEKSSVPPSLTSWVPPASAGPDTGSSSPLPSPPPVVAPWPAPVGSAPKMVELLRAIYTEFTDIVLKHPFLDMDQPVRSKQFSSRVTELVSALAS
jgi:hypothetical protein